MTTNAAENLAGRVDKEKVEKRRALGRGLESLLPGPRAVGGPGQSVGAGGKQQVPFDSSPPNGAAPLRAGSHFVRNDKSEGEAIVGVIQAVAGDAVVELESKSPLLAKDARNGAPKQSG